MRTNSFIRREKKDASMSSSAVALTSSNMKSPFFQPSNPKRRRSTTYLTTGEAIKHVDTKQPNIILELDEEHKSTIFGASCNLMNAIIGAGIVGMPFAIKEIGLGAGVIMIIVCAFLTDKSLRLLVETAKHVGVSTYELLLESCFGQVGFIFISVNMLILSYGALVAYLLLIKDTLPFLMGIDPSDIPMRRAVLTISSLFICLPLSSRRDVADLANTSKISVLFDCIMVSIVVLFSPISENAAANGGYLRVLASSGFLKLSTFWIGLSVLSFAFVCQHASFVIAGSLKNPTKERWGKVTKVAIATSGTLATCCGVAGYLGFQAATEGNILNSFLSYPNGKTILAANIARGLLCSAVCFVYPIESFVARHVCAVFLFKGRQAHGGDDHSVLARKDRRLAVTFAIYICALVPALLLDNLGSILAITGAVAGSSLSYVGPGAAYLAVHGSVFLRLVRSSSLWSADRRSACHSSQTKVTLQIKSQELRQLMASSDSNFDDAETQDQSFIASEVSQSSSSTVETILWYFLLMPLWIRIAQLGEKQLMIYRANEALKTPLPRRLGKVVGSLIGPGELDITPQRHDSARRARESSHEEDVKFYHSTCDALLLDCPNNFAKATASIESHSNHVSARGAAEGDGKTCLSATGNKERENKVNFNAFLSISIDAGNEDEEVEIDPQLDPPSAVNFVIAIGYIVFGLVALSAGLLSIIFDSSMYNNSATK